MSHIPGEVEPRSLLMNDYATTDKLSDDNLKCCLKFSTILDPVYQTYNLQHNLPTPSSYPKCRHDAEEKVTPI